MKKFRLLLMMLLAAAVSFTACNNGGEEVTPTDPNDPTVVVTLDEEELYPDAFMAKVVTTNAERAAWTVVAHDEPVVVANVLAEGVQIPAGELNNAEVPALVLAEDLTPATAYDLYVAVEGNGKQVLSAPLCVTTAEAEALGSVVEFYVDNSMGGGNVEVGGMSLDTFNQPGQYITISAYGEDGETLEYSASLIMFDHDYADFGCTSYSYLTSHHYPVVAGSFDMGTFPTTSALMADPGYVNFTVNGKTYYPVVPTAATDAEGNPYGVSVITLVPNGQDLNMLEFNLPVVDEDNNEYVLVGSYMGPIGYQLSKPKYPFDLEEFGYTEFVATQEGSIITLTSDTIQGKLEMAFDISHNDNVFAAEADAEQGVTYVAGEGNNWSGYYFMPGLDEATYYFNEGSRIALFKTETEGEYRISVGRTLEGGSSWTMSSESSSYDYEVPIGDYTIKVTGLGGGSDTPATEAYSLISTVENLTAGTYYMAAYAATNNSGTSLEPYVYQVFTGSVGYGKLYTSGYEYANGDLTLNPSNSNYPAVAVVLEAVEGQANQWYIKNTKDNKYLIGGTAKESLEFVDTPAAWTVSNHTAGGVLFTNGSVYMGSASANSQFIRCYPSSDSIKFGLYFFKEN